MSIKEVLTLTGTLCTYVLKEYRGFHNVVKRMTGDKGAQFSSLVKV